VMDADYLDNLVMLSLDGGEKEAVAGQIMVNGMRGPKVRVSSRTLSRRTGRDAVERSGHAKRAELEQHHHKSRLYRDVFEAGERATDEVLHEHPDNAQFMDDAAFCDEQCRARAKVQSKIPFLQNTCFAEIGRMIAEKLEAAARQFKSTKKPIILLGDKYGPHKCARGTRGHMTTPLVEYLAQFFLIVLVPEHLTSQLCPLCHCKTEFASKDSWRGKVCKSCVNRKEFYFDRDHGAASNIYYKAVFFMRSGGFYPPQYITKRELEKRKKLVLEFLIKLDVAIRLSGTKSANGDRANDHLQ